MTDFVNFDDVARCEACGKVDDHAVWCTCYRCAYNHALCPACSSKMTVIDPPHASRDPSKWRYIRICPRLSPESEWVALVMGDVFPYGPEEKG